MTDPRDLEDGEYKIAGDAKCPVCGTPLPLASAIQGDHEPKPGDLSLCIHCAAYLEMDDDLNLKVFPTEQLLELPDETRMLLTRARLAIKVVHDHADVPKPGGDTESG